MARPSWHKKRGCYFTGEGLCGDAQAAPCQYPRCKPQEDAKNKRADPPPTVGGMED